MSTINLNTTRAKSAVNKIEKLLIQAQDIAEKELGINNIFYNERFVELFIATRLNHTYGNSTQGSDATETDTGKPTEYKAINTRNKNKKSTFQFHWLSTNKVNKYKATEHMFFAIRDGVTITKIYKVDAKKIIPLIDKNATGSKKIDGHTGFSEKKLLEQFNPEIVYQQR